MKYGTGAIPSPVDERDYKITYLLACASQLPDTYINPIARDIPILNQLTTDMCVACSMVYTRWIQEVPQSGNRKMYSPADIYGNREADMYEGEGMITREALLTVKNYGVCPYDDLPGFYDYETAKQMYLARKDELDKKAYPWRISSFYRVSGDSQIKNAVMTLGCVTVMYPVYNELSMVKQDGKVPWFGGLYLNGYHEMTIVGWNEYGYICINSWGEEWGDKGFCTMPYKYPRQETWAIADYITETVVKQFTDVDGHWAEDSIKKAVDKGIIKGFEDGTFRPEAPLTRAQVVSLFDRMGLLDT